MGALCLGPLYLGVNIWGLLTWDCIFEALYFGGFLLGGFILLGLPNFGALYWVFYIWRFLGAFVFGGLHTCGAPYLGACLFWGLCIWGASSFGGFTFRGLDNWGVVNSGALEIDEVGRTCMEAFSVWVYQARCAQMHLLLYRVAIKWVICSLLACRSLATCKTCPPASLGWSDSHVHTYPPFAPFLVAFLFHVFFFFCPLATRIQHLGPSKSTEQGTTPHTIKPPRVYLLSSAFSCKTLMKVVPYAVPLFIVPLFFSFVSSIRCKLYVCAPKKSVQCGGSWKLCFNLMTECRILCSQGGLHFHAKWWHLHELHWSFPPFNHFIAIFFFSDEKFLVYSCSFWKGTTSWTVQSACTL